MVLEARAARAGAIREREEEAIVVVSTVVFVVGVVVV
jgi:hypothetical protein